MYFPGLSHSGEELFYLSSDKEECATKLSKNLWQDARRSAISVRLLDASENDISGLFERFRGNLSARQALVEFPGVLVPSFYPTLQALQTMSRSVEIPFRDLLAPVDTAAVATDTLADIPPPEYALRRGFEFDLSSITSEPVPKLSLRERFDTNALTSGSSLDPAQSKALVSALTKSMAAIQGPPGTGKSYLAIQLVKVLLAHQKSTAMGPVLCV